MKNFKYRVITLCGNTTLIINMKYKNINLDNIKQKYNIEQTGYLDIQNKYFEMEGQEFCGNGLRAAGVCLGIGRWKIKLNVYPKIALVIVTGDSVSLNIPIDMYRKSFNIVKSEGIAYTFESNDYGFSDCPCEGVIKIQELKNNIKIEPRIWVKSIGTIINETACASGSIAAAIYLGKKDCEITQPSGGKYKITFVNKSVILISKYKILL